MVSEQGSQKGSSQVFKASRFPPEERKTQKTKLLSLSSCLAKQALRVEIIYKRVWPFLCVC